MWDLRSTRSGSSHIGDRFRQRDDTEKNIPGTVTFDNAFLFSQGSGESQYIRIIYIEDGTAGG